MLKNRNDLEFYVDSFDNIINKEVDSLADRYPKYVAKLNSLVQDELDHIAQEYSRNAVGYFEAGVVDHYVYLAHVVQEDENLRYTYEVWPAEMHFLRKFLEMYSIVASFLEDYEIRYKNGERYESN